VYVRAAATELKTACAHLQPIEIKNDPPGQPWMRTTTAPQPEGPKIEAQGGIPQGRTHDNRRRE
jgi:hypothetical protein